MGYLAFLKFIPPSPLFASSLAAISCFNRKWCPQVSLKNAPYIWTIWTLFHIIKWRGPADEHLACHLMLVHTPFSRCSNTYTDWSSEAPLNHCRAIRFSSLGSEHFSNSNPFCSLAESSIFVPSGSQHNIHCEGVNELPKSHYS